MPTNPKNQSQRSGTPEAQRGARSTAADTSGSSTMSRRDQQRDVPTWRDPWARRTSNMLSPWRSWTDQMDRFFNSFGLGAAGNRIGDWDMWSPQIETFQRADELVIRADLPGLSKDDVNVEVTDDAVIIQGERRDETTDERQGFYRSERSYGSFYRAIPLPEGAITENVKANFRDGVLEISMPAPPPEANRGRRIEIGEGTTERPGARSRTNEPAE